MILVVTRLHLWCEWEDTAERTRGTPRKRWVTTSSDEEKGARFHCYKQKLLPSQWKLSLSFPALPLIRCHSWHKTKHNREREGTIKSRKKNKLPTTGHQWRKMRWFMFMFMFMGHGIKINPSFSLSLHFDGNPSTHLIFSPYLSSIFSPQWLKNSLVPQTSTNI